MNRKQKEFALLFSFDQYHRDIVVKVITPGKEPDLLQNMVDRFFRGEVCTVPKQGLQFSLPKNSPVS